MSTDDAASGGNGSLVDILSIIGTRREKLSKDAGFLVVAIMINKIGQAFQDRSSTQIVCESQSATPALEVRACV